MPEEIPKDAFKRTPLEETPELLFSEEVDDGTLELRAHPNRSICQLSYDKMTTIEEITMRVVDGVPQFTERFEGERVYPCTVVLPIYIPRVVDALARRGEVRLTEIFDDFYRLRIN